MVKLFSPQASLLSLPEAWSCHRSHLNTLFAFEVQKKTYDQISQVSRYKNEPMPHHMSIIRCKIHIAEDFDENIHLFN